MVTVQVGAIHSSTISSHITYLKILCTHDGQWLSTEQFSIPHRKKGGEKSSLRVAAMSSSLTMVSFAYIHSVEGELRAYKWHGGNEWSSSTWWSSSSSHIKLMRCWFWFRGEYDEVGRKDWQMISECKLLFHFVYWWCTRLPKKIILKAIIPDKSECSSVVIFIIINSHLGVLNCWMKRQFILLSVPLYLDELDTNIITMRHCGGPLRNIVNGPRIFVLWMKWRSSFLYPAKTGSMCQKRPLEDYS